jgi:hypothetical protein
LVILHIEPQYQGMNDGIRASNAMKRTVQPMRQLLKTQTFPMCLNSLIISDPPARVTGILRCNDNQIVRDVRRSHFATSATIRHITSAVLTVPMIANAGR